MHNGSKIDRGSVGSYLQAHSGSSAAPRADGSRGADTPRQGVNRGRARDAGAGAGAGAGVEVSQRELKTYTLRTVPSPVQRDRMQKCLSVAFEGREHLLETLLRGGKLTLDEVRKVVNRLRRSVENATEVQELNVALQILCKLMESRDKDIGSVVLSKMCTVFSRPNVKKYQRLETLGMHLMRHVQGLIDDAEAEKSDAKRAIAEEGLAHLYFTLFKHLGFANTRIELVAAEARRIEALLEPIYKKVVATAPEPASEEEYSNFSSDESRN